MKVLLGNRLDALVRLHTPLVLGKIGGVYEPGYPGNLLSETFYGPNAGLTEVLIPAGYVLRAHDPVFRLRADGLRYETVHADVVTELDAPGLPFSLVFHGEPGREDVLLEIASAYEAATRRRVPPVGFGEVWSSPQAPILTIVQSVRAKDSSCIARPRGSGQRSALVSRSLHGNRAIFL